MAGSHPIRGFKSSSPANQACNCFVSDISSIEKLQDEKPMNIWKLKYNSNPLPPQPSYENITKAKSNEPPTVYSRTKASVSSMLEMVQSGEETSLLAAPLKVELIPGLKSGSPSNKACYCVEKLQDEEPSKLGTVWKLKYNTNQKLLLADDDDGFANLVR